MGCKSCLMFLSSTRTSNLHLLWICSSRSRISHSKKRALLPEIGRIWEMICFLIQVLSRWMNLGPPKCHSPNKNLRLVDRPSTSSSKCRPATKSVRWVRLPIWVPTWPRGVRMLLILWLAQKSPKYRWPESLSSPVSTTWWLRVAFLKPIWKLCTSSKSSRKNANCLSSN